MTTDASLSSGKMILVSSIIILFNLLLFGLSSRTISIQRQETTESQCLHGTGAAVGNQLARPRLQRLMGLEPPKASIAEGGCALRLGR